MLQHITVSEALGTTCEGIRSIVAWKQRLGKCAEAYEEEALDFPLTPHSFQREEGGERTRDQHYPPVHGGQVKRATDGRGGVCPEGSGETDALAKVREKEGTGGAMGAGDDGVTRLPGRRARKDEQVRNTTQGEQASPIIVWIVEDKV
ncbi:hypothetical protein EYF80_061331 [Liparis tanakae]|uniref:Uncharacterized protein n=1 Tax=Liparis tanakae TaxID=230148 RepID=A0A4Z2EIX4_9TELE|nr:hypothetical protein EYF80_061331 [Liparis tanakae]